jgi:hypothetical protein
VKPFLAIVAHVYVVMCDVFSMFAKHHPRFVVAAYIAGILVTQFATIARATSILGLIDKKKHRIIIAADGLAPGQNFTEPNIGPTRGHACKIVHTADCVSAIAASIAVQGTFDIRRLAAAACAQSGDLRARAYYFEQSVEEPYLRALAELQKEQPLYYSKNIGHGYLANVLFAGATDGHLEIVVDSLTLDEGRIRFRLDQITPDNNETPFFVTPFSASAQQFMNGHRNWADTMDFVDVARKFIEFEIADSPNLIGQPISILEIGRSLMSIDPNRFAVYWVQAGACEKTENQK